MTYMASFSDEFEKIALEGETVGSALTKRILRENPNIHDAASGAKAGDAVLAKKPIYQKWIENRPDKAGGVAKGLSATVFDEAKKQGAPSSAIRAARRSGLARKVTTVVAKGLRKVAGEMQGYTRLGRKPISIEKMLSNESEITGLPEDFSPAIEKAASAMVKMAKHRAAALVGAGAVGALTLRQMNEDRKIGRMIRKQQAQQQ